MGVLTGRQIKELIKQRKLIIEPFEESLVQPASYDLRLGNRILAGPTSPANLGKIIDLTNDNQTYEIHSGQMVGIISFEKFTLPLDLCGRFGIKSSLSRKGLAAFGGIQLDPGFKGRLTINLLNVGPEPIKITLGEPFFTVEFSRLEEPAEVGYDGPFQNQDDFPAEQINYILNARTTSLAEIPILRRDIRRLSVNIEELLDERVCDPDEGLHVKPEIIENLIKSNRLPKAEYLTIDQIRARLD